MEQSENINYIIGDRIKNLPKGITEDLISPKHHKPIKDSIQSFTYHEIKYQDRRIICTYSEKRAKKDRFEQEKLIEKTKKLLENPSQLN